MAVDTPAKIAILGAGPIGLEAALYARYLGYEVEVFEQHSEPWHSALRNGHVKMLTPFGMNCSPLGLRAIKAQDEAYQPPAETGLLTYDEWHERYVGPLATTDLVGDDLRLGQCVREIGKVELLKTDCPKGEYDRGGWDFRLRVHPEASIHVADVVVDCSGVIPNWKIGHGGISAPIELSLERARTKRELRIVPGPRDVLGKLRTSCCGKPFAGASILVVGDDLSAAVSIVDLAELMEDEPGTSVIWVTRHEASERRDGPMPFLPDDPLEPRLALIRRANELAVSGKIRWLPGEWVEQVTYQEDDSVVLRLSGEQDLELQVDHVLVCTGYAPEWRAQGELQLDICPITDAARPFSQYLLKRPSPYSVEYPAPDASALITSEPNYYVLGSKSFGRMPGFLYQHGLRQIRDVFTIIADRAGLDLYAQMK
jgi:thioredoxin reductase